MEDVAVTWEAPSVLRPSIALVALTLWPVAAFSADVDADPTNYRTMFDTVGPGDTLRLAPGEYRDCLTIRGKHGTDAQRIVIEGADVFGGGVVFYGANCTGIRNATIFIEDSSYLTIRNIEISLEQNLANGIRAGYGDTPVHHVTVTGMYIHDNDANNQHSAVGVFATSWDWHIHGNRFERNGLGMYLGDSDGSAPFIRGTIERNLILEPTGQRLLERARERVWSSDRNDRPHVVVDQLSNSADVRRDHRPPHEQRLDQNAGEPLGARRQRDTRRARVAGDERRLRDLAVDEDPVGHTEALRLRRHVDARRPSTSKRRPIRSTPPQRTAPTSRRIRSPGRVLNRSVRASTPHRGGEDDQEGRRHAGGR